MKQIFSTNLGVAVKDAPVPFPGDNEVQVRIFNSLISVGTESSSMKSKSLNQKYEDTKMRIEKLIKFLKEDGIKKAYSKVVNTVSNANVESKYRPIGYSNSGIVVAKGKNVTKLNVGDRVACGGNGFAVHGEYAIIPKNLAVRIPTDVTYQQAAFTTVGSIAMQGLRRSDVKPGEWIIIYGVGLLGLIAVQIAKAWGLNVIAIDIKEEKLALAKEFGANVVINSIATKNIKDIVNSATNGYGADSSIIYASTSSSELVNTSFSLCREKANIVIVGAVGMDLVRDDFYRKEQNLIISTSYGPGRYDDEYEIKGNDYPIGYVRWTENRNMQEMVSLLSSGRLTIEKLLTKSTDYTNATAIYTELASPLHDEIGVLFNFEQDEEVNNAIANTKVEINQKPIEKDQINIGVIGAGGYVKSYILPYIKDDKRFNLIGLSNKTPQSSLEVGNGFGFNYVTGNYKEILEDENIDFVIVGTRHDLHAKLTLEVLEHNKYVFVEKPLSLDIEGIDKILEVLQKTDKKCYIGFNRRYSELVQKLKKQLNASKQPKLVNFRINAGNIPASSWIQDASVGGGRIIGEACHFIDLCNYIIDDEIVSFDINAMPIDNKNVVADDNFVIIIKYKNGSLANVIYTSLGGKKQAKELLEVFSGGKSYVINDFMSLEEFSHEGNTINSLKEQDKGRAIQFDEIFKDLKGNASLIPAINFDLNASILAVKAQEKLYGRE